MFDARAAGVAQIVGSVIGGAGRADAVSSCARGCSPGRLCPWRPRRPRWPNRSTIEWYDARELLCSRNRGFVRATAAHLFGSATGGRLPGAAPGNLGRPGLLGKARACPAPAAGGVAWDGAYITDLVRMPGATKLEPRVCAPTGVRDADRQQSRATDVPTPLAGQSEQVAHAGATAWGVQGRASARHTRYRGSSVDMTRSAGSAEPAPRPY